MVDQERHPDGYNDRNPDVRDPDFKYDNYGNLIADRDKEIKEIVYNHLNLPVKILFENGGEIDYIYDALGVKLRKEVRDRSEITTTDYLDGFIYLNEKLDFFPHAEGYVKVIPGGDYYEFQYVFQYKDHLGNIRLSYSDTDGDGSIEPRAEIVEEHNYYPFGLQHKGYNNVVNGAKYNYKQFQGQEWTEDHGLNIHEWKYRFSDPALGRFWQNDPLAENYAYQSTYQFASNQPIHANELEGQENLFDLNMRSYTAEKLSKMGKGTVTGNYKDIQQAEVRAITSMVKEVGSFLNNLFSGGYILEGESKKSSISNTPDRKAVPDVETLDVQVFVELSKINSPSFENKFAEAARLLKEGVEIFGPEPKNNQEVKEDVGDKPSGDNRNILSVTHPSGAIATSNTPVSDPQAKVDSTRAAKEGNKVEIIKKDEKVP